ncbi:Ti-type conjugative transfer relaxase TraA [uncultured Sphingosinicella sp.]|uniref:Ti-type conjugative transfer relaxase TraA n=1 Tax=uncultured Sphingosinicella sp. TaxID=478748 RepID=UPI0030D87276
MAIYHFSAKVISRSTGASALASAAYRSASRLHDQRLDRHHDFTNKAGVIHAEVMLPEHAPEQLRDREALWNSVEAAEVRKDAQLAREVEFALPRELEQADAIAVARDFVQREFVERGMCADLNVHWDIDADGMAKPHAHVMLTMREVDENGFGAKVRDWNSTQLLEHWREAWAQHQSRALAERDIDITVDHRSLAAQGIELEPQNKIGPAASRMADVGLSGERLDEHRAIARANGERILKQPEVALDALTHQQATFTRRELAMFVHRHSDGKEQFDRVLAAVEASPALVALGKDGREQERFTSRAMLETEQRLEQATERLQMQDKHAVRDLFRDHAVARAERHGLVLSSEQRAALDHVTEPKGLGVIVGYAGTGKSALLGVAREAWEDAGYRVRGLALSGIAAENLEAGSRIASRTIAAQEHAWAGGTDRLTGRDVLVIDEAGMIGTRQMERVLSHASEVGAKVVLVGDPEQLQAIEAGAAFRSIHERHGGVEVTEIRRQHDAWQRDAVRQLATGRTAEAVHALKEHDRIHAAPTEADAKKQLIDRWDRDRKAQPQKSRLILAHTRADVAGLNALARQRLRLGKQLGDDVRVETRKGPKPFARGDRVMFLRNEKSMGVKNGSLGRVESVSQARMAIMLDDGRAISFDTKLYTDIDHGYAATIHKAQGVTVDRSYVLATGGMDRHGAYVALSRHRERVDLHYGKETFKTEQQLVRTLARDRGKDMVGDYGPVADKAEAFAARRGITLRERVKEITVKVRDMFEGLQLKSTPIQTPRPQLEPAVEQYARTVHKVREMGLARVPMSDGLRAMHERDEAALDAIRPGAARDLRNAWRADLKLLDTMARGDVRQARALLDEAERVRSDPAYRADRFVAEWTKLRKQQEHARFWGEEHKLPKINAGMAGLAKSLERDAQMESLLRPRTRELGLGIGMEPARGLSRELSDWFGLSRGRGLSR